MLDNDIVLFSVVPMLNLQDAMTLMLVSKKFSNVPKFIQRVTFKEVKSFNVDESMNFLCFLEQAYMINVIHNISIQDNENTQKLKEMLSYNQRVRVNNALIEGVNEANRNIEEIT